MNQSPPNRYVFVWMGSGFPYPCRLAVESVLLADPGASVLILLHGPAPLSEHFAALQRRPSVTIRPTELEELFGDLAAGDAPYRRLFDAIPTSAYSARSNLLRYAALHRWGGVYLDFDVLVRARLWNVAPGPFVGIERVWRHDRPRVEQRWTAAMAPGTVGWSLTWFGRRLDSALAGGRFRTADRWRTVERRWSDWQPNNAVIGSPAGARFTASLLDRALDADPTVRFALGPSLLTDTLQQDRSLATVLPPEVLYPVAPSESFRFFEDGTLTLGDSTALIHYVSSNHARLLATVVPGDSRFTDEAGVFWRLAQPVDASLRSQLRRAA